MRHIEEALYKKMQLFSLPFDTKMALKDIEELFEINMQDFLLQEVLSKEEWYDAYLPETLHRRFFDERGEVSFQELDETMLKEILLFRQEIGQEWQSMQETIQEEKKQIQKTAPKGVCQFLKFDFTDSEIRKISGMNTDQIMVQIYPQWDFQKIFFLKFKDVKDSWTGKFQQGDANWWLADEITVDENQKNRYFLQILFGNMEQVSRVQFSFSDIEMKEKNDFFEM